MGFTRTLLFVRRAPMVRRALMRHHDARQREALLRRYHRPIAAPVVDASEGAADRRQGHIGLASSSAAQRYQCPGCGYVYDEARGDSQQGFAPDTSWEAIPARWRCPDCAVRDKVDFVRVGEPAARTRSKLKVLKQLPSSLSNRDLADALFTGGTLKWYLQNICSKLGVAAACTPSPPDARAACSAEPPRGELTVLVGRTSEAGLHNGCLRDRPAGPGVSGSGVRRHL